MHAFRQVTQFSALIVVAVGCSRPEPSADTASTAVAAAAPMPDSAAAIAAVRAAVDAHWKAIKESDTLAIVDQHTIDITFFGPESDHRVSLSGSGPEVAALMKRFRGATARWTPRDVQVQLFGDAAVATFYNDGSVTYADRTVDKVPRKVTEVWVRQADGKWKEAHHHDSRMGR